MILTCEGDILEPRIDNLLGIQNNVEIFVEFLYKLIYKLNWANRNYQRFGG